MCTWTVWGWTLSCLLWSIGLGYIISFFFSYGYLNLVLGDISRVFSRYYNTKRFTITVFEACAVATDIIRILTHMLRSLFGFLFATSVLVTLSTRSFTAFSHALGLIQQIKFPTLNKRVHKVNLKTYRINRIKSTVWRPLGFC